MAEASLPDLAIARNIADTVQVIAHISRREGVRCISEVVSVERYHAGRDQYDLTPWN